MDGIRIPDEVAQQAGVPDDLDSSQIGPYRFPSPARRMIGSRIYLVGGILAVLGALANLGGGLLWVGAGFFLLSYLHFMTSWPLVVQQEEALIAAAVQSEAPVGHASAALGFEGLSSRPAWNVILYSAENPPRSRTLVRLDAVTGQPIDELYTEQIEPPSDQI
ncbi:MAG: hypothetical protein OXG89_03950 [bacterium]|nr:hypothetical protein [bacterium]